MSSNDCILIIKIKGRFMNAGIIPLFEVRLVSCVDNLGVVPDEEWPLVGMSKTLEEAIKNGNSYHTEYGMKFRGI